MVCETSNTNIEQQPQQCSTLACGPHLDKTTIYSCWRRLWMSRCLHTIPSHPAWMSRLSRHLTAPCCFSPLLRFFTDFTLTSALSHGPHLTECPCWSGLFVLVWVTQGGSHLPADGSFVLPGFQGSQLLEPVGVDCFQAWWFSPLYLSPLLHCLPMWCLVKTSPMCSNGTFTNNSVVYIR